MWVDPECWPLLQDAGLNSLESVMATRSGRCLRAMPERENWRLELHGRDGAECTAHLKKHRARSRWTWARRRQAMTATPAELEARNAAALARDGFAVMRVLAYGRKAHADGLIESFVLTEELQGYQELQHFLRDRLGAGRRPAPSRRDPALAALIRAAADVARRFHQAGYNHRDFYAGHFFVCQPERGAFDIRLIDLQRVQQRRRWRRRWIVKDLAQLAWSLPGDMVSCAQRMAFMQRYFGVARLQPRHKRLIREVLAKQQMMTRRLGAAVYGAGRQVKNEK